MATPDAHGLGYERVDDDPSAPVLLAAMDATAGWAATRELRAWEREQLALRGGQRLLDVGCGLGDAALDLARDLGEAGEVVGIDASEAMISGARARAGAARTGAAGLRCRVRFDVGDAMALNQPADSFDAVRCERTLQWVADPAVAVGAMARVLRPTGRLSLIDTDWSTFALDAGDEVLAARVRAAFQEERGRPSNVGRRLADLARAAGLAPVAHTRATETWTSWDPDRSPAPDGCFSMSSLVEDLVDRGQLDARERDATITRIHDAARAGRFAMRLTMYAVVAEPTAR